MTQLQLQIGNHRFKVRVAEQDKSRTVAAARTVSRMLAENSHDVDGERAALRVALLCASGAAGSSAGEEFDQLAQLLDDALAETAGIVE